MNDMNDHHLARKMADGEVFTSLGAAERRAIKKVLEERDAFLKELSIMTQRFQSKTAVFVESLGEASKRSGAYQKALMDVESFTKHMASGAKSADVRQQVQLIHTKVRTLMKVITKTVIGLDMQKKLGLDMQKIVDKVELKAFKGLKP